MGKKERTYKHAKAAGAFDEEAHITAQAKEREKRGAVAFTRNELFGRYMTAPALRHEKDARNKAYEDEFQKKFDSKLGRYRKNRGGPGNIGIANQR